MSIKRKIKKNIGIIKKPYGWCKSCHVLMDKKEGYCYICPCCGKEKPLESEGADDEKNS